MSLSPALRRKQLRRFAKWRSEILSNTFIASISEHDNSEDLHGRLSMWRAFGRDAASVAIVFKTPFYSGSADHLSLLFSPVAYLRQEEAYDLVQQVIHNVRAEGEFLRSVDRSIIGLVVESMLLAAVTCLKHEGFHEEREWRAIYTPRSRPSTLMESSTEILGGVPQTVYKIPLDGRASSVIEELDLFRMFDRLIIGPSVYSQPSYDVFVSTLQAHGIEDAKNRVLGSGIPIRT